MDHILTKKTHGRKEIERKSYAEVLANGAGAIKRVDNLTLKGRTKPSI